MEDAATAEISRAQVWQWAKHEPIAADDRRKITRDAVRQLVNERGAKFQREAQAAGDLDSKRAFIVATKLVSNQHRSPPYFAGDP